jgi:2-C-methyl-D-erythritol 4-phosphate cytidylyltransferase
VKSVDGDRVASTEPRERLVAVQTPQAFLAAKLRDAYAGDLAGATDCSSLVEARGGRVKVVEGDPRLLKVTTEADLEQVAAWL